MNSGTNAVSLGSIHCSWARYYIFDIVELAAVGLHAPYGQLPLGMGTLEHCQGTYLHSAGAFLHTRPSSKGMPGIKAVNVGSAMLDHVVRKDLCI